MSRCRSLSSAGRRFTFCALIALLLFPGHMPPAAQVGGRDLAPYIARGQRVEEQFRNYRRLLERYFESLSQVLKASAPDLLDLLKAPDPLRTGYQILPEIVAGVEDEHSLGVTAYSWPWTESLIDREMQTLTGAETELQRVSALRADGSRSLLERLAAEYRQLSARKRNIDAHVQYNRFWQAAIATDQPRFDRETRLQRLVLQRRSIAARLSRLESPFKEFASSRDSSHRALRLPGMVRILKEREALIVRQIDPILGRVELPGFVTVDRDASGWIFRVPLWTDIEDRDYVGKVKRAIETIWRARERAEEFRVELDMRYIAPADLYKDAMDSAPAAEFDLERHLNRFPLDVAVLTTGAITTHVRGRAIVLGPHSLTARVLAHEFGHVLGFRDGYIRGYRDLGVGGFQIVEAITDSTDIMASPHRGRVKSSHFEKLVGERRVPQSPVDPVDRNSRVRPAIL